MTDTNISRRNFLGATGLGAGLLAMGALAGCAPKQSDTLSDTGSDSNSAAEGAASIHSWEQPLEPITDFVAEEDYEIVVIGAGIAGCAAAQSAAEAGANVLLVEKFEGVTAHGQDNAALGSKLQIEKGYEYNKGEAARLVYDWSQSQANWYLIKTFVENSADVLNHYIDMAPAYGLEVVLNDQMTARSDWYELEERFRQLRYTAHNFINPEKEEPFPNINLVTMLCEDAQKNGATVKFNTKAEQLVKEGDKVVGVVVSDDEGYKRMNASKGVILATGGISCNPDMVNAWCPLAAKADNISYFPEGGASGDGIVMGMQIGAARSRCYPAPLVHPVQLSVMGPGFDTCWLYVNNDGMRFCCEMAYEPTVTNARMNSVNNVTWAVWDSHYPEHVQKQEPHKSQPWMATLEDDVEAAVANEEFVKADTLDELAEKIGVPADNLKATVARYNGMCAAGVDDDFGVPERFLSSVEDGPFYACRVNAWTLAIPYGLHVDTESRVCTDEDEPIEGLYAVGNVQGDFFANSYPVAVPGISHGRALTFGRLIGQNLANGTTLDAYQYGK
ncbi:FAD-dependent oxidoreductase [Adlercreutzia sp. R21]|uniref:FAD-dependent oxidoreductase n=1 Tax=Adlercreutzia wanghongyangiae TaxID=3111451 RepID=A0ABU6IG94_9ACTN|nr:FAD-dependent oxidoreductase [Adlercreutzia sp. R21]MEC4175469.1 FAD-dependent oxidoreductase [Adlercreutzia sp. R7]MEC4183322.1 FAD-dependent oxidoreductase [Adlercreutzia sp. R21]